MTTPTMRLGAAEAEVGARAATRRRRRLGEIVLPYLLILPAVGLVFGLTIYPTIHVIRSSLTNWSLNRSGQRFIGLANYESLLEDPQFWLSLWNTAIFSVGVLVLVLSLGLVLALALNERLPFQTFFRSSVIMPWAITAVVAGVMWRWMLMPDIGIVPYVLSWFGVTVPFFLNSAIALAVLICVEVWRSTGYAMVLILAGLQGIDPTLHEAAEVDGASYVQYVRGIVIPLLVPTILIVTILMTIRTVNLIDLVLAVTGGGPARQTETLGLFMWKESFQLYSIGYGSAIAVLMFVINLVMTYLYIRVLAAK